MKVLSTAALLGASLLANTGSTHAAARMPTTPALMPAIADCTPSRLRSASQNGSAPTTSSIPGRKIAASNTSPPSQPVSGPLITAPR